MNRLHVEDFTQGYIEAMLLIDCLEMTDDGNEVDFSDHPLSDHARNIINIDWMVFLVLCYDLIKPENFSRGRGEYSVWAQAGHDFWLTRRGHGVGYWDGDWNDSVADKLTKASRLFSEYMEPYLGDDGLIYFGY